MIFFNRMFNHGFNHGVARRCLEGIVECSVLEISSLKVLGQCKVISSPKFQLIKIFAINIYLNLQNTQLIFPDMNKLNHYIQSKRYQKAKRNGRTLLIKPSWKKLG